MLDKVRERLEELISSTRNEELLKKYNLIKQIILYDKSFIDMDSDTAISILMDLNFSEAIAKDIYLELLKEGYAWNIQAS